MRCSFGRLDARANDLYSCRFPRTSSGKMSCPFGHTAPRPEKEFQFRVSKSASAMDTPLKGELKLPEDMLCRILSFITWREWAASWRPTCAYFSPYVFLPLFSFINPASIRTFWFLAGVCFEIHCAPRFTFYSKNVRPVTIVPSPHLRTLAQGLAHAASTRSPPPHTHTRAHTRARAKRKGYVAQTAL